MSPSDADMIEERYHYFFIHKVFGNFYKDVLDYFSVYLYPRFQWTVVGTYDKAVEYITKTEEVGREPDKLNLPALILNPSGELNTADANAGGKQLWRFPNLAPGLISRLFHPVYQDEHMLVTPAFSRFKGEIELIMLLNSFYEYCDMRIFMIQIFGGQGRYIYPRWFNSFIIIPKELINYTYDNDVTGVNYSIDWDNSGASDVLINTINQTEKVLPLRIKPILKMTGMSDASTKYGGDKLAEWKLSVSIEFEVEFPTFMVLETDYLPENINFNFGYSSGYSSYSSFNKIVNESVQTTSSWDSGLTDQANSDYDPDEDSTVEHKDKQLKVRYFHVYTQAQEDSTANIIIEIPEQIDDYTLLKVNSKHGEMIHGEHFNLINNGNSLEIIIATVSLLKDDIVELFIYEYFL